ncbi:phosphoadenylyl-sulfate reductase [Comamonas sp. NLF-1-9]|uniref:phosphoadenylyl-sulfate reductase n=1 Tax=Comamonas sp. NLF-1-9 TaxID=2853163 RepID=UPI001C43A882|nr:phosphoadenylyl-sulfate reductase [Comamonas sp. NLF-1-9]QXL84407.1 phosphoadenylyl-sulfate reductase [Comamonas sp. NLF-1-9]
MANTLTTPLAQRWNALLALLQGIAEEHPDALLASSMGVEDTLLIHALMQVPTRLGVFMLDTGRLHKETLAMVGTIEQRYGITVQVLHPEPEAVRNYVQTHGLNAFYESVELRKLCCDIRKVQPLRRVLAGHSAWITGQRREQSSTRAELPEAQWDEAFGLHKYNPLASWHTDEVWAVVRALDIPYNPLHDRGYASIGCECCTRAIRPGEDIRAGRWWWEQRNNAECGLHTAANAASPLEPADPPPAA